MHTHTYTYVCIYIYIHSGGARSSRGETSFEFCHTGAYIYGMDTCIYIYVYVYLLLISALCVYVRVSYVYAYYPYVNVYVRSLDRSWAMSRTRWSGAPRPCFMLASYGQSPYWYSGFQRVWLKQNLQFKGWNCHVRKEFPGKFESINLSRDNLSREIGRTNWDPLCQISWGVVCMLGDAAPRTYDADCALPIARFAGTWITTSRTPARSSTTSWATATLGSASSASPGSLERANAGQGGNKCSPYLGLEKPEFWSVTRRN